MAADEGVLRMKFRFILNRHNRWVWHWFNTPIDQRRYDFIPEWLRVFVVQVVRTVR